MPGFRSILLPAPEVEALVDPFRQVGDWSRRHGIPAHLTLAGPFPPTTVFPREALADLASELRGTRYELASIGLLGPALCLFPAEDAALLAWRGQAVQVIGGPDAVDAGWRIHLTVCRLEASPLKVDEVRRNVEPALPVTCEVGDLLVAEMNAEDHVQVRRLE